MNLHNQLVEQVLNDPQTPADHAVRNEILNLRAMIAELQDKLEAKEVKIVARRKVKDNDS